MSAVGFKAVPVYDTSQMFFPQKYLSNPFAAVTNLNLQDCFSSCNIDPTCGGFIFEPIQPSCYTIASSAFTANDLANTFLSGGVTSLNFYKRVDPAVARLDLAIDSNYIPRNVGKCTGLQCICPNFIDYYYYFGSCQMCSPGFTADDSGRFCIPLEVVHTYLPVSTITSTVRATISSGTETVTALSTSTPSSCRVRMILMFDSSCCPSKYISGLRKADRPSTVKRQLIRVLGFPGLATTTRFITDLTTFTTVTSTMSVTVPATTTTSTSTIEATQTSACAKFSRQVCPGSEVSVDQHRSKFIELISSHQSKDSIVEIDCGVNGYFKYEVPKKNFGLMNL